MVPLRTLSARLSWFAAMKSGMYMDGLGFMQRMYGSSCSCKFQSNTWALSIALPRSIEEISQPGQKKKNRLKIHDFFSRATSTKPDLYEATRVPQNREAEKKRLSVEILPLFSKRLDSVGRPRISTSLSLLLEKRGVRNLNPCMLCSPGSTYEHLHVCVSEYRLWIIHLQQAIPSKTISLGCTIGRRSRKGTLTSPSSPDPKETVDDCRREPK